ncbi:MAG: PEP-CTERM sorting domain-containing protein [Akkermansiaceae bacterium]
MFAIGNPTQAAVVSFENPTRVSVPDNHYVISTLNVGAVPGIVTKVTIEFRIWTSVPLRDLDVKVRHPNLTETLLFSDIVFNGGFGNTLIIVDDEAPSPFPNTLTNPSGATFIGQPTNYGSPTVDNDPTLIGGPGPLSRYAGENPTGNWLLFASDDVDQKPAQNDSVHQIQDFRINIYYDPVPEPSALALISIALVGSAFRRHRLH